MFATRQLPVFSIRITIHHCSLRMQEERTHKHTRTHARTHARTHTHTHTHTHTPSVCSCVHQARQLSARGGELSVELVSGDSSGGSSADASGDRVIISGRTAFYMEGTIHLQAPMAILKASIVIVMVHSGRSSAGRAAERPSPPHLQRGTLTLAILTVASHCGVFTMAGP